MRLIVEQPVHTMVTNVQGTEVVLEYCNKFGKRVLIASSSEVYGDHREERPLHENDRRVYGPVTERRWLYADSKAMDEFLALGFPLRARSRLRDRALLQHRRAEAEGQYGMVIPRFVESALAGPAARGARRRPTDTFVLPRTGHDPGGLRTDERGGDLGRDLQRRVGGAGQDPRSCPPRPRDHGLPVGARVSSRTSRCTDSASRTCSTASLDREDQGRDRLAAEPRPRPDPRRRCGVSARVGSERAVASSSAPSGRATTA